MEIILSFDDTGSMSSVRREVRSKINNLITTLFDILDNLRIGIIIHNDYCDRDTIQKLELTDNKSKIIEFINRGSSCGGGDADECYELVLNEFTKFDWQSSDRLAIMIGDCNPHQVGYKYRRITNYLDWRVEAKRCTDLGIILYTIQALGNKYATNFYETVAKIGNGIKLDLSQFAHITQYITAIAYKQADKLDEYESSDEQFKTNYALKNMFSSLKGLVADINIVEKMDTLSRFQVMKVLSKIKIKKFVEDNGIHYKKGKGFYQLVNPEIVQANKEVLMVSKATGEVISDTIKARETLGLPYGTKGRLNPHSLWCCRTYDVYIQSNSYTRDLDPGTKFLYELDAR